MAEACSICAKKISDDATPAVLDQSVVCMDCHDKANPMCPYCHSKLEKRPQSLTPCPFCGRVVHIRSKQSFFPSTILTKTQADRVDAYGDFATARAARKELEMQEAARRKPAAKWVINAIKDEDAPARRLDKIEQMRQQPATESQMKFASDVGLILPAATQWHASRLLTAFQELRFAIENVWNDIHGQDPIPSHVGQIVMILVDDVEFQTITKRNDYWADVRVTELAIRRIKQVIRQNS